jgi:hypothetical protein
MIPAEVVDIGMTGEHICERFGRERDLLEKRRDYVARRCVDTGVDQHRLLAAHQILRERPRSEDALDSLDSRGYFDHG